GYGDGGNQRGSPVAQEDENHKNDQDDGENQRALHVVDRCADGGGAVQNDGGLDALRDRRFDRRQRRPDSIHGLDDVGARLAEDGNGNRGHAIQVTRSANVLRGVRYVGYVGEPDSGSFFITHNQRLVIICFGDLVVDDDIRGRYPVG